MLWVHISKQIFIEFPGTGQEPCKVPGRSKTYTTSALLETIVKMLALWDFSELTWDKEKYLCVANLKLANRSFVTDLKSEKNWYPKSLILAISLEKKYECVIREFEELLI